MSKDEPTKLTPDEIEALLKAFLLAGEDGSMNWADAVDYIDEARAAKTERELESIFVTAGEGVPEDYQVMFKWSEAGNFYTHQLGEGEIRAATIQAARELAATWKERTGL